MLKLAYITTAIVSLFIAPAFGSTESNGDRLSTIKVCSTEWTAHKAKTSEKGIIAFRAFQRDCLTQKRQDVAAKGDGKGRERQKACGAEWKTSKSDPAVKEKGWPAFYSACNKRLKGNVA